MTTKSPDPALAALFESIIKEHCDGVEALVDRMHSEPSVMNMLHAAYLAATRATYAACAKEARTQYARLNNSSGEYAQGLRDAYIAVFTTCEQRATG